MQRALLILSLSLVSSNLCAAGWGDLKVKFVYDGAAPIPVNVVANAGVPVCGQQKLVDESLVVNAKNRGIKNIASYIYLRSTEPQPSIHSSYDALIAKPVVFDNDKCRFEPRVVGLWTAQKLTIGNKDPIAHNAKLDCLVNPPQNPLIPPGANFPVKFAMSERLPTQVSCSIHPWMRGFIVIRGNPYIGVSDENGDLVIKYLPAGTWTMQFWQEKSGYVQDVKVGGKSTKWSRGRVEVTIPDGGAADLGTVTLNAATFKD